MNHCDTERRADQMMVWQKSEQEALVSFSDGFSGLYAECYQEQNSYIHLAWSHNTYAHKAPNIHVYIHDVDLNERYSNLT